MPLKPESHLIWKRTQEFFIYHPVKFALGQPSLKSSFVFLWRHHVRQYASVHTGHVTSGQIPITVSSPALQCSGTVAVLALGEDWIALTSQPLKTEVMPPTRCTSLFHNCLFLEVHLQYYYFYLINNRAELSYHHAILPTPGDTSRVRGKRRSRAAQLPGTEG